MIKIFEMDPADKITFPPSGRDTQRCYDILRWLRDNQMEFHLTAGATGDRYLVQKGTIKDLFRKELQIYVDDNLTMWFFLSNIYCISLDIMEPED